MRGESYAQRPSHPILRLTPAEIVIRYVERYGWYVARDVQHFFAVNRSARLQKEHHILRQGGIGIDYTLPAIRAGT